MEMMDRNAGAIMGELPVPAGLGRNLMEMLDWNAGATLWALPGNGWLWWGSDGQARPEGRRHTLGSPGQWMPLVGI